MLSALNFVESDVFHSDPNEFTNESHCKDSTRYTNSQKLERFLGEKQPVKALLYWLEYIEQGSSGNSKEKILPILSRAIAEIDNLINQQVNDIIHHSSFQQLEASWRGLLYLAEQTDVHDREQKVKLKLLSLSWRELSKDISRAIDFDQSEFFKLIYGSEFDIAGGEPFGVLIGDYQISHRPKQGSTSNDIDILKDIARTSAAAFAPFITSAHPSLFGVDHFSELGLVTDITNHFQQIEYIKWRSLRSMEDSKFLGITAPQILMRAPYLDDGSRNEHFKFKEHLDHSEQNYLWGNSAYAFAAVLVRAFSESGWFGQIRGLKAGQYNHGIVTDLPVSQYETTKYQPYFKPSVNVLVGDRLESELSDNGFIPLSAIPYSEHCAFFSNASVQSPPTFDKAVANVNARLSSMLQYIMCVSRFAHYIKVMGREKVGSFQSAQSCERELQRWLHGYTTASDSASEEVRARYPLHEAQIQVREIRGQPGRYFSIMKLQPHFQLDQMVSSIKLVTELSPKYQSTI
ncbi:type VI secretion system contractile sheath large subunit [Litoribrevibacter albus]|uniref:Type VI secretion protein n=1 Tax=Litoribrevibacter albus TaxID=1473156 RepID=A0AA37SBA3_9GAMM|nr:type VI secretion system contractile sheath large subunit [Litoribrevibacter albus]GLQ31853.1 type VI secretion protein [Litoribrevibacter albus]